MKNKLMLLFSSPSDQFETQLFVARIERYFKQSKQNSPLLFLASLVLAGYQFYLNTPLLTLIIWQSLFGFFIGLIYYIQQQSSYFLDAYTRYKSLRIRLFYRFVCGLMRSVLFGASCFFIPAEVAFDHLALYYVFLICLFSIILISNVIFPEYYFGYGLIVITLVYIHTWTRVTEHSEGFMIMASLIYPIGAFIMTIKALEMSKRAINEVALGLILKKQVVEMLELQQVIKHQSEHDELTGLANRRKFEYASLEFKDDAKSQGSSFGLVYIDLDQFKPINDTYGHTYGDLVLQEIAKRLNSCTRKTDLVCRMGGDEFCILVQNITEPRQLQSLSLVIEQRVNETFTIEGVDFNLGASIGTAVYPQDGTSVDELVLCADQKMYQHKQHKLTLNH